MLRFVFRRGQSVAPCLGSNARAGSALSFSSASNPSSGDGDESSGIDQPANPNSNDQPEARRRQPKVLRLHSFEHAADSDRRPVLSGANNRRPNPLVDSVMDNFSRFQRQRQSDDGQAGGHVSSGGQHRQPNLLRNSGSRRPLGFHRQQGGGMMDRAHLNLREERIMHAAGSEFANFIHQARLAAVEAEREALNQIEGDGSSDANDEPASASQQQGDGEEGEDGVSSNTPTGTLQYHEMVDEFLSEEAYLAKAVVSARDIQDADGRRHSSAGEPTSPEQLNPAYEMPDQLSSDYQAVGETAKAERHCRWCRAGDRFPLDPFNVALLARYLNAQGMIKPRRFTNTCAWHQRKLRKVVRRARHLGFISYKKGKFTIQSPFDNIEVVDDDSGVKIFVQSASNQQRRRNM